MGKYRNTLNISPVSPVITNYTIYSHLSFISAINPLPDNQHRSHHCEYANNAHIIYYLYVYYINTYLYTPQITKKKPQQNYKFISNFPPTLCNTFSSKSTTLPFTFPTNFFTFSNNFCFFFHMFNSSSSNFQCLL